MIDQHERRDRRRLMLAMFIAGASVYLQAYDVQAILPAVARAEHVSATTSVLSLSATTLGMAVGVLPWAYVSDRVGRFRVIRACLIAACVATALSPLMPHFALFILLRLVKGFFLGGVTGLAVAYLFERLAPVDAAVAAGIYISGNTVGGVTTRVFSALLEPVIGWRLALEALGGAAVLLTGLLLFMTRNERSAPSTARPSGDQLGGPSLLVLAVRTRVLLCFVQGFVSLGVFIALFSLLPFQLDDPAHSFGAGTSSAVLALYGSAFFSAQASGRLSRRFGLYRPLMVGYAMIVAGLLMLMIDSLTSVVAGVLLSVLGIFLVHPLNSSETGRRVPTRRAQSTAIYQIAWLLGASAIAPLASYLYQGLGWTVALLSLLAFIVIGAACALADARAARKAEEAQLSALP